MKISIATFEKCNFRIAYTYIIRAYGSEVLQLYIYVVLPQNKTHNMICLLHTPLYQNVVICLLQFSLTPTFFVIIFLSLWWTIPDYGPLQMNVYTDERR